MNAETTRKTALIIKEPWILPRTQNYRAAVSFNGLRVSRVAGVEDSCAGKTRRNNQSLRWGGAVATSAARAC